MTAPPSRHAATHRRLDDQRQLHCLAWWLRQPRPYAPPCPLCGGRGRLGSDIPCWRCGTSGLAELTDRDTTGGAMTSLKRITKPLLLETELPGGLIVVTLTFGRGRPGQYYDTSVFHSFGSRGLARMRATTEEQARANHAALVEEWHDVPLSAIAPLLGEA